MYRDQSW